MLKRSALKTALSPPWRCRPLQSCARRRLMTLAVETSCDDTSVAIVEKGVHDGNTVARLHFHKKVTSNNAQFGGVHPLLALKSHQENLASLVAEAIEHLPIRKGAPRLPDFVSVTRGPGMRSNLFTGLDTAKGLAVAWQVKHGNSLAMPQLTRSETSCRSPPHASPCLDASPGLRP
jgi:N6-L-threonylcarbamoyladenine synthase